MKKSRHNSVQRLSVIVPKNLFAPLELQDNHHCLCALDVVVARQMIAHLVRPAADLHALRRNPVRLQHAQRDVARACTEVYNDWCKSELMDASGGRLIGAACLSIVSVEDAVAELQRVAGLGFRCAFLPTTVPAGKEYADEQWEPLWAAAEEAGVVLGFHIGTGDDAKAYRGRGGAVINYLETTFPGMRVVAHMVGCGALDAHPNLKIMIAEGGASWVPAIADRMDEGYRQHGPFVKPKLSMLPSELIYRQVYTSFQHDRSAVAAVTAMNYRNVMWGDDYPHLEGTYGHTQQTLHDLFDDVPADVREAITIDVFSELLGAPKPPAA